MRSTLYIVWNQDGDVCADSDRDVAIERMSEEYGGELQVAEMTLTLPEPVDIKCEATIPAAKAETVTAE